MVSVIVPVYNAEKTLSGSLNSIIGQTYSDLEIILVDDGSTDRSGELLDRYAKKDRRIRVIHKEHGGVSSARNRGLDAAGGEYVYFADADDVIGKNAIRILTDLIPGYDMAFAGHLVYDIHGKEKTRWKDRSRQPHEWDREEALDLMFDCSAVKGCKQEYCYIGYCFNKLFKRAIIERSGLRFNGSVHYNEDRLFVVSYLLKCGKSISARTLTYKYMLSENSITLQNDFDREKTEFDAFDDMIWLLDHTKTYYACVYSAYKRAIRFYLKYAFSDKETGSYITILIRKYGAILSKNREHYYLPYRMIAGCLDPWKRDDRCVK